MKTFYNRSLNWINYLLGCLLGLLGFSCDGIGETPDEYGTLGDLSVQGACARCL